jgi:hypothetical protein
MPIQARFEMKKRRISKGAHARIQVAITGMIIPIMTIPPLYDHALELIADGADDEQLAAGLRKFMGHEDNGATKETAHGDAQ